MEGDKLFEGAGNPFGEKKQSQKRRKSRKKSRKSKKK
jgi:hypothetical protein